tara:strand:+ start:9941 stop:10933 length:993 start_codon:yes stop_codon:yes gene_type:complete
MLNLLPYALAAYGGYRGYRDSKEQGIGGINRLLNTAVGAGMGYYGGKSFVSMPGVQSAFPSAAKFTPFTQTQFAGQIGLGAPSVVPVAPGSDKFLASQRTGGTTVPGKDRGIMEILTKKKDGSGYDPLKIAALAGGVPFVMGAFDQGPADIYMPGYNMSYLELKRQRGNFKYIDPATGQEKEYDSVYAPEEQGIGDRRLGPYSLDVQRLNSGGLAQIKKFNEGGINYLPSKISHDENDSNNYVRASGYVEDGSGAGDKDEDTMLAQLADGEFVTRADGVLGAGIIAGGNPNSIKDMREKGAQYFYEQQKRYKRVFDLLKESNGNTKQKEN